MSKPDAILSITGLTHIYQQAERQVEVLRGANLELAAGEIVGLVGPSGAGKSTLMHLAGLLETVQDGVVRVQGQDMSAAREQQRTHFRRHHIGFVYQFHNLLAELTVIENVAIAARIAGDTKQVAAEKAVPLLTALGLGERLSHFPSELSGGEQQRVAIARALVNQPVLVLADEPTGSLDTETGQAVFDLMMQALKAQGAAALIATHNMALAQRLDRIVRLEEGVLK